MIIFWDVDTQYDFLTNDGKLYITGAESIISNLSYLTHIARQNNIPVLGSIDYHHPDDEEITNLPDFINTFPPHCLAKTRGAAKIEETAPVNPIWVDSDLLKSSELREVISDLSREIIFRKQRFDVFSNPNTIEILNMLKPENIFVYGVSLDVCVAHAINGMLKANLHANIHLVKDAVKAIYPKKADEFLAEWKKEGVISVTTEQVEAMVESHIVS